MRSDGRMRLKPAAWLPPWLDARRDRPIIHNRKPPASVNVRDYAAVDLSSPSALCFEWVKFLPSHIEEMHMQQRALGDSGIKVTLVGLGCNNFGKRADAQASRTVIERALDLGITLFDTADIYGGPGGSEKILGD